MVLMLVAFRFRLAVPQSDERHAKPAALDIYVRPDFGFYLFLVATMLSLALIIAFNRHAVDASHARKHHREASTATLSSASLARLIGGTESDNGDDKLSISDDDDDDDDNDDVDKVRRNNNDDDDGVLADSEREDNNIVADDGRREQRKSFKENRRRRSVGGDADDENSVDDDDENVENANVLDNATDAVVTRAELDQQSSDAELVFTDVDALNSSGTQPVLTGSEGASEDELHRRRRARRVEQRRRQLEAAVAAARAWRATMHRSRVNEHDTTTCTAFGQIFVIAALVTTLVGIAVACAVPSFVFEFGGAAGLAMRFLNGSSRLEFSLIGLGNEIRRVGLPEPYGSAAGMWFLQVTFVALAVGAPLLHTASMLVLWVVPMRAVHARRFYLFCEVAHAWAALDVFGVSLVVALLEIGQFATFIIGTRCDPINALLRRYFDEALEHDDVCFSVETQLLHGCFVLIGAFLLYVVVSSITMRLCHASLLRAESSPARRAVIVPDVDGSLVLFKQRRQSAFSIRMAVWLGFMRFKAKASKD